MNMNTVKNSATAMFGRSGLVLKKYSPEILLFMGITSGITSTVMACKATLKADEVVEKLQKQKETIEVVHDATKDGKTDVYSEEDYMKDKALLKVKTLLAFGKLYGPAIGMGIFSITCILSGHNIMRKRNVAAVGAYKLAEKAFSDYRKRVVEDFGIEKDYKYLYGLKDEVVEVVTEDEDGKKKKTKKTIQTVDTSRYSQYARFFDELSINWDKNPEYNLVFLKCQQNYLNDRLQSRGHVFLNEVYDALGIPRSQAGQLVGWVKGQGDNYIDFGIFDEDGKINQRFISGCENVVLLDFNVDGVIYDLI